VKMIINLPFTVHLPITEGQGVRVLGQARGSQSSSTRKADCGSRRGRCEVADDPNALARILIAPRLIYIGAVIGVPFVLSLWFAVSDVTVSSAADTTSAWRTSGRRWGDPSFRRALRNTFLFAVASQVIVVILATRSPSRCRRTSAAKWIVRLLILLPWVAPVSLGASAGCGSWIPSTA